MYGIFINIGPQNHPNVVRYTIHGAYGIDGPLITITLWLFNIAMEDDPFIDDFPS